MIVGRSGTPLNRHSRQRRRNQSSTLLQPQFFAHGDENDVAAETNVWLTRVVEEQHHWLVFLVAHCHEVEIIVGDLYVRILEVKTQGPEGCS